MPDGMPTVWVGRLRGHRANAPRLRSRLHAGNVQGVGRAGYRHFLVRREYGSRQILLKQRLEEMVPGINIVGTYTPPFRPLNSSEEDELAGHRPRRQTRYLLGWTKHSQTGALHGRNILTGSTLRLMVGVGAAFDIHAGLLPDAPPWMKNCGLQWLYRLLKEPRRLWRRYLSNNPRFLWSIGLQLAGIKKSPL